ncbi:MAG: non-hydrolyzing UDP-N-acetylglucosamine 2-epimerase [Flavobacteriaceae bacterium]
MGKNKRILTVVGARPQFIKAAVLSRFLKGQNRIEEDILHTGQHYDHNMSEVFFDELGIPKPKYQLEISGRTHGAMTGHMLEGIEKVLLENSYDALLVYGDTNSTLAGALAAQKLGIPVIHIEAGLRSFNMEMPEEVNRILTDRLSSLLCCPTKTAVINLEREGFDLSKVVLTGDIMKTAVDDFANQSKDSEDHILLTVHRQENTDDLNRLKSIFEALEQIAQKETIIFPIHPRTAKKLEETGIETSISLIDPVSYKQMQELLSGSRLVITDSGGLQKEAYFHGKRGVILREQTEWTELVDLGFASLVGAEKDKIIEAYKFHIDAPKIEKADLYGTQVVEKIYQAIIELLWE